MKFFFVFQNKTFEEEKNGSYLWAPKGKFSHWKNMQNVKIGDIIFHSYKKQIVAVSQATSNCYDSKQPNELKLENLWNDDGFKVDCTYYLIENPITIYDYIEDLLELQPKKYAPFNSVGRGNTGYLFDCNYEMASFLINKIKEKNNLNIKNR